MLDRLSGRTGELLAGWSREVLPGVGVGGWAAQSVAKEAGGMQPEGGPVSRAWSARAAAESGLARRKSRTHAGTRR